MKTGISGVILAGGENKRFGGIIKSNILIDGDTIISRMLFVINDFFDEIIIVTNKPEEFRKYNNLNIVKDHFQKAGPLGGIHAALRSASSEAVFVFAGDMPFLDKEIIEDQILEFSNSEFDVLIPRVGKLIEPLHAIYSKSIFEELEVFIACGKKRAVRDFLHDLNVGYLEIPGSGTSRKAFTNINSPGDISRFNY
jgi:molybdopterin-guanine dinucleotide biosynthesis protein A